jgi:lipopolysaccharide transport system ATP-binding protein
MSPAIKVEGLAKLYHLGLSPVVEYHTLRETLSDLAAAPLNWIKGWMNKENDNPNAQEKGDELWALRGVSFKVQPGEVLGVIGRNGAGKSTLLKIFSRITQPTVGRVELRGRVGSLLEVGTGFHPELTGRENVFLNGAILGMTRKEIDRKFDEIVAFAEIERFLDTPVKRYSSGMYTRLAFAVASHLEPEILIVDEVLAVGDAAFQKKCLGRMGQVSREGRTVLFVSHNMTAVKSLCDRGVLLEKGKVTLDGSVDDVVDAYLTAGTDMARTGIIPEDAPRYQDVRDMARFRSVRLLDIEGNDTTQLYYNQPFKVQFVCDVLKDIPDAHFEVSISTVDGTHVTYSTTMDRGQDSMALARGQHVVTAELDVTLLPRQYTIDLGIHTHNGTTADMVQRTLDFTVLRVAEGASGHYPWPRTRGLLSAPAKWDVQNHGLSALGRETRA